MRTLVTLALVAASTALFADGNTSTATATVGVKIVSPISIVNPDQSQLNFGWVTVDDPTQGISVAYPPAVNGAGTATYTNCSVYPGHFPGGQAWFHLRKDHDLDWANVNVTVPAVVPLGPGVLVTTASTPWYACGTYLGLPILFSNTTGDDLRHFWVGGVLTADAGVFGNFSAVMTVVANYQ